jgi:hypothetical protein
MEALGAIVVIGAALVAPASPAAAQGSRLEHLALNQADTFGLGNCRAETVFSCAPSAFLSASASHATVPGWVSTSNLPTASRVVARTSTLDPTNPAFPIFVGWKSASPWPVGVQRE